MDYPVCELWLKLVNKYNTTQPFLKFSKEYSLDYNKVRGYGANVFTSFDYVFIEKVCGILNCEFDDLFKNDEKEYLRLRGADQPKFYGEGAGVVYFIRNKDGYTKIGKTQDLRMRLLRLKHEPYGEGLKIIHFIESKDITVLEKTLHQVFARKRIKGEWFNLTDEDIDIFKDKKKGMK